MDEKEKELLSTEEAVEETTEEAVEEIEETEEAVEEAVEEIEEAVEEAEGGEEAEEVEDSTEALKYVDVTLLAKKVKALKIKNIALTVVLAIVILGIVAFSGIKMYINYNPYNHMGYPNTSALTIEEYARFNGMHVEDLKKELQLPEDVKNNTYLDVVNYIIPFGAFAENYGMDVETAKQTLQVADFVTAETPYGEALDTVPLSVYIGTGDALTEFIEEYELPDTVTEETLWGEVRRKVLMIEYKKAIAPKEEEEVIVEEEPQVQSTESQELTEEELAEIMAYLETATDTE